MKKTLVIASQEDTISTAQREPFIYNRRLLRQQLDLQVEHIEAETFSEIAKACENYDSEIVFLLPSWRESASEAERVLKKLRQDHPHRQLIFIDPRAQVSTKYFNVLPYVDRFLKRQCYKNLGEYKHPFIGGSMFTDFLAKHWQFDFQGWYVGSDIPEGYEHRIIPGWNLGTAKRFQQELQKPFYRFRHPIKEIDIFCRLSLGTENKQEWYCQYRQAAVKELKPLESVYKVVASGGFVESSLVPRRQYLREIKSSRIVFSPFGWGETCWRDFEAVCYGCLLIKPSMAHIDTKPNIFIEGETYVSVRWDFADLQEKCRYYLENPDEATQIVENARRVYTTYFEQREFVKTIEQVIT